MFKKGSGKGKGQDVKPLFDNTFGQAPEQVPIVNDVPCRCDGIRMVLTHKCGSCGGLKDSKVSNTSSRAETAKDPTGSSAQSQDIAKTVKQELVNMSSEMRQQAIRLACSTQSQDIADFMTCSVTQSQEIARVVSRELYGIYWKPFLSF